MARKKKANHYVDNEALLAAMIEWKAKLVEAEESGEERPRVPEYVGECLFKIATHLSYKSNFINYSYREDMILDGVENCLMYIHNFDPEKSKNPFAYFTQIIYYAFLRRISKEKKQSYVKQKMIHQMPFEQFEVQDHDADGDYVNSYIEYMQNNTEFDDYIERKKERKKKQKQMNALEELIQEDGEDKPK